MLELGRVCRRVGELEVADLPEVAIDGLLVDQPLHELSGIERLPVERLAGIDPVALDELAGAPLVAGVDDAAVPRGRAPSQRMGLEQRDRDAPARQLAGGHDARVATTDHDDICLGEQVAARAVRERRHRRLPERTAFVVGVQRRGRGHGRERSRGERDPRLRAGRPAADATDRAGITRRRRPHRLGPIGSDLEEQPRRHGQPAVEQHEPERDHHAGLAKRIEIGVVLVEQKVPEQERRRPEEQRRQSLFHSKTVAPSMNVIGIIA